jgi:hypothetical protein
VIERDPARDEAGLRRLAPGWALSICGFTPPIRNPLAALT